MKIEVLSLFPDFFRGPFHESIVKRAQEKGLLTIEQVNIRDFAEDKHKRVDDRPYGGGAGMVLKPEPLLRALRNSRKEDSYVVYLSPRGKPFSSAKARSLAEKRHLILVAGHYEGIDERVLEEVDEEISIGDYILTNGCVAAIVVVDAVARFIPGVLGDETSALQDSFSAGLLEHGHYTRPPLFEGKEVPEALLEGDHAVCKRWRRRDGLKKSYENRADLYMRYLTQERASLVLEVEEIDKSIRFYRKVLGFPLEWSTEVRAAFLLEEKMRLILVEGVASKPQGALYTRGVGEQEFRKIREQVKLAAPFFDVAEADRLFCRDLSGHLWMIYIVDKEKENG